MILIFYYSLLRYNVFEPSQFILFDNYLKLFSDKTFWQTFINSLIYLLVTPILIIISLILALAVREATSGAKFFRTIYFLPVVTPIVIVGIIWRWIFSEDTGLMNYLLSLLSLPKIFWLTDYPTNIISVMLVTIWRGFGYYLVIFLAGLAVIPKGIEDASRLDGASYFQQAYYILIPNLKPTITLIFVISSTAAIKLFIELYILIPGAPMDNKTIMLYLYRHAFERFDLGYGSAIGVVLFLLTLGFSYVNVKMMERS
ncbi:MAG: sugar ABC transporter permease [Bacteroidetes bacterium]|nr:sugar ABC transporter permease [Bacteroidota bacterium]MBU2586148.1 sugar ABC transporter permease [Bacteroidota bacterium]